MKRMASKKSYSWWWDSHISRKNSKWLEENLEAMDKNVKEMLKLIEEEGDSFAKKAEMYYQKRPELISHVEDFYRMYRALAERYDQVTGDLRKNIRSGIQSQGSYSGSVLVSDPPSPSSVHTPELTPESKRPPRLISRAAGFDFFLGAGDSPDRFRKISEDSSSSSESESDVDDSDHVVSNHASSRLHQRILKLRDELSEANEKLKEQKEKCYLALRKQVGNGHNSDHTSDVSALECELSAMNKKIQDSEAVIMNLQQKLEEQNASLEIKSAELEQEKKTVVELYEQIAVLQETILAHELEIQHLKEAAIATGKQFETDVMHCNIQIVEPKNELANSNENFFLEKPYLKSQTIELKAVQTTFEKEVDKILQENLSLEARVADLEHVIRDLKARSASTTEKIIQEKLALEGQYRKQTDELNKKLNALKVQNDILTTEKLDLAAKVDHLMHDVECRDDGICEMEQHLHNLHLENAKLITEIKTVRTTADLSSRVQELEEEVDMQKIAISDSAEGKREAIRQLCFSLEHYRDGYKKLRQILQEQKQLSVMAN